MVRDESKRYSPISGGGGEIGLHRGVELLDAIAAAPEGEISAKALADLLAVDVPQIVRALHKLSAATMVELDHTSDQWRLSTGMMRFFRPLLNDQFLARFIRPVMQELNSTYQETVSWFVPYGWEQVVVEVLPSPHPIRYVLERGARQPTYLGAAGKAHLATLEPKVVSAFLAELEPVQLTRFQLDKATLKAELEEIRKRGYATSDSERVEGAASVAVSVRGPDEQVMGVISVMMPKFRMSAADFRDMSEMLKARTAALFQNS
ncbi:IclR family transcriptional regulator [Sedimentitalea sp. XS_ASV28]